MLLMAVKLLLQRFLIHIHNTHRTTILISMKYLEKKESPKAKRINECIIDIRKVTGLGN